MIFFILLIYSLHVISNMVHDITKYNNELYQYVVINGKILDNIPPTNGQQPEKRYEIIDQFLDQYKRPFTMLDLGAAQGYHSLLSAWKHPESVFVMVEGNNAAYRHMGDQLLTICKHNNKLNNIVHLNKQIIISDLVSLSECEHFDVILALNVIHWLGNNWRQAVDVICSLGDNIIIETPPAVESKKAEQIINYLINKGAELIAYVPRHHTPNSKAPMFLVRNKSVRKLARPTWLVNRQSYEVESDFYKKKFKKIDAGQEVVTDWIPGINLITFKMYNGAYPLVDTLKQQITLLKDEEHTDWNPNNFIVQGNSLKMIDYNSSFCAHYATKPRLYGKFNNMLKFIEAVDRKSVEAAFWKVIRAKR